MSSRSRSGSTCTTGRETKQTTTKQNKHNKNKPRTIIRDWQTPNMWARYGLRTNPTWGNDPMGYGEINFILCKCHNMCPLQNVKLIPRFPQMVLCHGGRLHGHVLLRRRLLQSVGLEDVSLEKLVLRSRLREVRCISAWNQRASLFCMLEHSMDYNCLSYSAILFGRLVKQFLPHMHCIYIINEVIN